MRFHTQKKHMIDLLFPIALFFVFAASALTVLLLATNIYRSTTEHSYRNYTAETSLAYITEKIHQNDMSGTVSIEKFAGKDALTLKQDYEGTTYVTYIYTDDSALKELYIKEGTEVDISAGKTILPIESFTMQSLEDNTFRFVCTDKKGVKARTVVRLRSEYIPY